jgi:hypothetical protein
VSVDPCSKTLPTRNRAKIATLAAVPGHGSPSRRDVGTPADQNVSTRRTSIDSISYRQFLSDGLLPNNITTLAKKRKHEQPLQ